MSKLAVVDIDGVISNSDERFARAERLASQAFDKERQYKQWTDLYWGHVFDPQVVSLDTLIDGASEGLDELEQDGYEIILLTSRPEHMRERTVEWCYEHEVESPSWRFIFKPKAFQYVKTVIWKAGTIQQLAAMFEANEVIVVDDEQANIDELQKHTHPFKLKCYKSLALEDEDEGESEEEDENPF